MAANRTTSLDLPPVLSQLLGPMTPPVTQPSRPQMPPMQQAFNPANMGMSAGLTTDNAMMPGYAEGGIVDRLSARLVTVDSGQESGGFESYYVDQSGNRLNMYDSGQEGGDTGFYVDASGRQFVPNYYDSGQEGDQFGMPSSGIESFTPSQPMMSTTASSPASSTGPSVDTPPPAPTPRPDLPNVEGSYFNWLMAADPSSGGNLTNYAEGGMVGAGGIPVGGLGAPGMPQGGMPQMAGSGGGNVGLQPGGGQQPMNPQQVEMQIKDFMQRQPQQVAQIQQVIQAGLQAGEITMEDMNMLEQLAMTALQNPEMYPYVRQFAVQQGFAGEEDISPQYDEGLVITALIAARVAKQGGGAPMGGAPMGGAPMEAEPPSFAMGGMVDDKVVRPGDMAAEGGKVKGPGTGTSDSVPIRVSTGEYVIPANVVRMKGKEFFDSMLEKYKDT